jgi:beta-lactamase regulating signal transducer with metallopeptidase domain
MIPALLDHLWQSTLFAALAGLLTFLCARGPARIRFGLWLAASLKFLLPFSLLAAFGTGLAHLFPAPPPLMAIRAAAHEFVAPTLPMPDDKLARLPWLAALWLLGLVLVMAVRLVRAARLQRVLAGARDTGLYGAAPVRTSASLMEPGLVGILRPVVLLPSGLLAHLTLAERDAILAHEFSHFRRRDNLAAALHMLVEALFWFWPPVWLIGARLWSERERACDESVLAQGHDRETYAGAILKVCKFCIRSPLACAAGVSGADLGKRVSHIMLGEVSPQLDAPRAALLAGAGILALGVPVLAGFATSPLAGAVHRQVVAVQARAEQVLAHGVSSIARQIGAVPTLHVAVRPLPRLQAAGMEVSAPVLPAEPPAPVVAQAAVTPPDAVPPKPAAASRPAIKADLLAISPTGAGDPEAITCRVPQQLPGSRLAGPQVCKTNRVWAALRAQGQDISPDGTALVATAAWRPGEVWSQACGAEASLNFLGGNSALIAACR